MDRERDRKTERQRHTKTNQETRGGERWKGPWEGKVRGHWTPGGGAWLGCRGVGVAPGGGAGAWARADTADGPGSHSLPSVGCRTCRYGGLTVYEMGTMILRIRN